MAPEEGCSPHEMLWAPWRSRWVSGLSAGARSKACPFCRTDDRTDSVENLVVHRTGNALVMLNLFPYNGGHLLVIPQRHVQTLGQLEAPERAELMELVVRCQRALDITHRPHGFNVGLNEGKAAGAGLESHLHWHVVPRWQGDASFMTSIGGLRVTPEDLPTTWTRVRAAFESLEG